MRAFFSRPAAWWTLAVLFGIVLCIVAVNDTVYEATSPTWLDFHVALRKSYSIVAFAVVGFPIAWARVKTGAPATTRVVGGIVAAYSALIEVLQYFAALAANELPDSIADDLFDVLCGFIGGAIAVWIARRLVSSSRQI